MTQPSLTPLQAARQLIQQHPDFRGIAVVISVQPKGRNGHKGLAQKETRFNCSTGAPIMFRPARGQFLAPVHAQVNISHAQVEPGAPIEINLHLAPGNETRQQAKDRLSCLWLQRTNTRLYPVAITASAVPA